MLLGRKACAMPFAGQIKSVLPGSSVPVALLLSLFSLTPAARADWPIFRGTSALTGVASTTLPNKPALLWTFKTGGPVHSSAVVGGGKAFIGADDSTVYAIDFSTGHEAWHFKADSAVLAPPLLAGNSVYVGSAEGIFYALDAASGALRWKFTTDGKIAASANVVMTDGKPRLLFGSYDFKLYCLDAATSKPAWTFETGNYINGACAVNDGQTVFGGCDAILRELSVADGSKIKEVEAGAYIAASIALAGDDAYFGHYDNEFLCVDLHEGKIRWRFKDLDFPYMSAAAVTSDRVIFGGYDKTLHCLNRADGKEVWRFATQGKIESSPVVADGAVVFGSDDGRLYIVALRDGAQLWSYDLGQSVVSAPAVTDKKIVIGSLDGNVYCFGPKQ